MALEIVGAGFGRTGTLSLKQGLEQLGFAGCYHMLEVFARPGHHDLWREAWRGKPDWEQVFEGFRAAVDWPACAFWRELMDYYPESKILLSERDPESWFESASNTIFQTMRQGLSADDPEVVARMQMAKEIILDGTFGGDLTNREHAIAVYEAHNAEVKRVVPAERLIVFDVKQGWEPLCEALGRPVPDTPFPRVNTTEEFTARFTSRPERRRRRRARLYGDQARGKTSGKSPRGCPLRGSWA